MNRILLLIIVIQLSNLSSSFAQGYDTLYFDKKNNSVEGNADYHYITTHKKISENKLKRIDYYKNGVVKLECNYYTKKIEKVTSRKFKELREKKKVKPEGFKKSYSEDGRLTNLAEFDKGKILYSKSILEDGREIYNVTTKAAEFPGGVDELFYFVKENLIYPENALKNELEGTIFVKFIVSKSGKVIEPKVLKGLSKEVDQKVLNLISKMPNWSPPKYNNNPVDQFFVLPIRLRLYDY